MTEWKRVNYIKDNLSASPEHTFYHHQIVLPEPLASWDVFDYWERERLESMKVNLTKDDLLYDVGAEHGWLSVIYASACPNIFLIEPTKEFWPNIYQTWKKNLDNEPAGCYMGLITDSAKGKRQKNFPWPEAAKGELVDKNKYEYIHEHSDGVKKTTIDRIAQASGIHPTALTIDTEGSELLVLMGAKETLEQRKPKLWVSIHPDLMTEYGHTKEQLIEYLQGFGYIGEHLATDHEEHWYFHV